MRKRKSATKQIAPTIKKFFPNNSSDLSELSKLTEVNFILEKNKSIYVKKTDIGFGLFAATTIPAGTKISNYLGQTITEKAYTIKQEFLPDRYKIIKNYVLETGDNGLVRADKFITSKTNFARFANHSLSGPNVEFLKDDNNQPALWSKQKIPADWELLVDYGKLYEFPNNKKVINPMPVDFGINEPDKYYSSEPIQLDVKTQAVFELDEKQKTIFIKIPNIIKTKKSTTRNKKKLLHLKKNKNIISYTDAHLRIAEYNPQNSTLDISKNITSLMWSCYQGDIKIAKDLIKSGADVNFLNHTGKNALVFLIQGKGSPTKCVKLLPDFIKANVDFDQKFTIDSKDNYSILHIALREAQIDIKKIIYVSHLVTYFQSLFNVETEATQTKNHPLLFCIEYGYHSSLTCLLQHEMIKDKLKPLFAIFMQQKDDESFLYRALKNTPVEYVQDIINLIQSVSLPKIHNQKLNSLIKRVLTESNTFSIEVSLKIDAMLQTSTKEDEDSGYIPITTIMSSAPPIEEKSNIVQIEDQKSLPPLNQSSLSTQITSLIDSSFLLLTTNTQINMPTPINIQDHQPTAITADLTEIQERKPTLIDSTTVKKRLVEFTTNSTAKAKRNKKIPNRLKDYSLPNSSVDKLQPSKNKRLVSTKVKRLKKQKSKTAIQHSTTCSPRSSAIVQKTKKHKADIRQQSDLTSKTYPDKQEEKKVKTTKKSLLHEQLLTATLIWQHKVKIAAARQQLQSEEKSIFSSSLKESVKAWGYKCCEALGDVNCFYQVVSQQLRFHLNFLISPEILCVKTIQHIVDHWKLYNKHNMEDQAFVARMSELGEWTDMIHVIALHRVMGIDLTLLRSDGKSPMIYEHNWCNSTFILGYQVGIHFCSLLFDSYSFHSSYKKSLQGLVGERDSLPKKIITQKEIKAWESLPQPILPTIAIAEQVQDAPTVLPITIQTESAQIERKEIKTLLTSVPVAKKLRISTIPTGENFDTFYFAPKLQQAIKLIEAEKISEVGRLLHSISSNPLACLLLLKTNTFLYRLIGEADKKEYRTCINKYMPELANLSKPTAYNQWFLHSYYILKNSTKEQEKHLKYLKNSAEAGYALAQYDLGFYYSLQDENGESRNYKEAAKNFQLAADQGSAQGQVALGECYQHGYGVEKDVKQAVEYYKLAATQNNPKAQYCLAECYTDSTGVAVDAQETIRYLRLAVTQNYPPAQYRLALCYRDGKGVEKDPTQAYHFFCIAAKQEHPAALKIIAENYNGEIPASLLGYGLRALQFYYQSAKQYIIFKAAGDRIVEGFISHQSSSTLAEERIPILKIAAAHGHAEAQYYLGVHYEDLSEKRFNPNESIKKNKQPPEDILAFQYYKLAAEQDNILALYKIAEWYELGRGVEENLSAARSCYLKAAELCHKRLKPAAKKVITGASAAFFTAPAVLTAEADSKKKPAIPDKLALGI